MGRSAAGAAVGVAEEEIVNTALDSSYSISSAFSPYKSNALLPSVATSCATIRRA